MPRSMGRLPAGAVPLHPANAPIFDKYKYPQVLARAAVTEQDELIAWSGIFLQGTTTMGLPVGDRSSSALVDEDGAIVNVGDFVAYRANAGKRSRIHAVRARHGDLRLEIKAWPRPTLTRRPSYPTFGPSSCHRRPNGRAYRLVAFLPSFGLFVRRPKSMQAAQDTPSAPCWHHATTAITGATAYYLLLQRSSRRSRAPAGPAGDHRP